MTTQEHWTPELSGSRAVDAWSAAVRLVSGGVGWPASRCGQLDALWLLAVLNHELAAEARGWPFGTTGPECEADRVREVVVERPRVLEYLAPFMGPELRRLVAEDLADTAGDLACLLMKDAVWFGSQTAFRMMLEASARIRPAGKQDSVSRETSESARLSPVSLSEGES